MFFGENTHLNIGHGASHLLVPLPPMFLMHLAPVKDAAFEDCRPGNAAKGSSALMHPSSLLVQVKSC